MQWYVSNMATENNIIKNTNNNNCNIYNIDNMHTIYITYTISTAAAVAATTTTTSTKKITKTKKTPFFRYPFTLRGFSSTTVPRTVPGGLVRSEVQGD